MSVASFFIAIVPLLALVCALLARRYPGERTIERLRGIIASVRARPTGPVSSTARIPVLDLTARGGRLIACFLAGRAPPEPA